MHSSCYKVPTWGYNVRNIKFECSSKRAGEPSEILPNVLVQGLGAFVTNRCCCGDGYSGGELQRGFVQAMLLHLSFKIKRNWAILKQVKVAIITQRAIKHCMQKMFEPWSLQKTTNSAKC